MEIQTLAQITNILTKLEAKLDGGHDKKQVSSDDLSDLNVLKKQLEGDLSEKLQELEVIKPLLDDHTVTDILINGPNDIYVEQQGKLNKTGLQFGSDNEVLQIADKIVNTVGRKLDRRRPLVDARLLDGSRVNVIAPPLSVDGTVISIRKFSKYKFTLRDMVGQGNMSDPVAEIMRIASACKMNVLISGGTGAGKTTLLNAISEGIDDDERIVTVEDSAELKLLQPHVVRLETKPYEIGHGEEEVSMRDLVKNALRMRPDRIIVGEVRGAEAFDMMQAMNTGHEGSMTTIHANHPRDALSRVENMISMADLGIPTKSIRYQMASALNLIVQISRMRDGHRRITYITEVVGTEGDIITLQDLFQFKAKGFGADKKIDGKFVWSGIVPRFIRRVNYYGLKDRLANALGVTLPEV